MRVTMTESRQAAPDGVHVVSLMAGTEYDLPDRLALRYIERGLAVLPGEQKAMPAAPENKAEPAAPENKAPARRTTRRKKETTR